MDEPGSLAGYPVAITAAVPAVGSPQAPRCCSAPGASWWSAIGAVSTFWSIRIPRTTTCAAASRFGPCGITTCAVRHPQSFAFAEDLNAG